MAVALMSVTSVHQDVFAKDAGMSLTAIAEEDGNIIDEIYFAYEIPSP